MIVATDSHPELSVFQNLMGKVDAFLNDAAKTDKRIQSCKGGNDLEPIVCEAAQECAKGTSFEGKVELWSGGRFPDIVASGYYGIEVKSTIKDQWTSTGSSILESTRIDGVERIYLTFGKLGDPIAFLSRPYEECLCDIAVTHYPRYKIDMMLKPGDTIFDKLGIPYDDLRKLDNPVAPVADYYRKQLKKGESLWWTGARVDDTVPAKVRLWGSLSASEKDEYEALSYVYFPECILSLRKDKYTRMILWLATRKGIIHNSLRDSFSAGGRVEMRDVNGIPHLMPRVFHNIESHIELIKYALTNTPPDVLSEFWGEDIEDVRVGQWLKLILKEERNTSMKIVAESVLARVFLEHGLF